jgi:membrane protein implicated in regulation of membrane protease activity
MTNRGCAVGLLSLLAAMALFFFGTAILLTGAAGLLGYADFGSTQQQVRMVVAGLVGVGAAVGIGAWISRLGTREEDERRALAPADAAPRQDPVLARWTVGPDEWRACAASERRHAGRNAAFAAASAVAAVMIPFGLFGAWEIGIAVAAVLAALVAALLPRNARLDHAEDQAAGRGEVVVRRHSVQINGAGRLLEDGRWWIAGTRFLPDASPAMLEIVMRRTSHTRQGPRTIDDVVRVPVARGSEDQARRIAGDLHRSLPAGEDPDDG